MARRSTLLIAAIAIAALGTLLIILYVQGVDERATEDQELVEVLVATEVIEPGESLEDAAGKIETRKINKVAVVAGAISATGDIEGEVALETIYPDEQIIEQHWGQPGTEDTLDIPESNMAISVDLADPDRVAGFVTPGSEVAIFSTCTDCKLLKPDGTEQALPTYTRMIVPRTIVLGVGTTTVASRTTTTDEGETTTEEIPRTVLTISVSQDQAEKVILGRHGTELTFALLNEESDSTDEPGAFLRGLFPDLFRGLQ